MPAKRPVGDRRDKLREGPGYVYRVERDARGPTMVRNFRMPLFVNGCTMHPNGRNAFGLPRAPPAAFWRLIWTNPVTGTFGAREIG